MQQHIEMLEFFQDDKTTIVFLPFADNEQALAVFVMGTKNENINDIKKKTKRENVLLKIPKFNCKASNDINTIFEESAWAWKQPFARFQNMTTRKDNKLEVGQFIQKVDINVDCTGVKAKSVTAVEIVERGILPQQSREIVFDSPFTFAIVEKNQLFSGFWAEVQHF